jgi:alcohol dehydrogenase
MGRLEWVETRPLGEGAQAFADLEGGRAAAAKMMLRPRQ